MDPNAGAKTAATAVIAGRRPLLQCLSDIDAALSRTLHHHNLFPRPLFLLLELSADFRLFFPLALSIFLSPTLSALLRPFLVPLLLGLLLDLALIGLIKIVFRRPRPVYNKNMSVAVSVDHYSFPSGHSSRVCFVAALFYLTSESIKRAAVADHRLVLWAWLWAAATSVSRVLLGRHYAFDVFVGSCLGVLEGLFAFHYLSF
ncbi:hypothetical protein CDL15_Pgr017707 [Punica granatum]|nr:hypothetical protein CDL15_Pgr017707 [Punica granatum]